MALSLISCSEPEKFVQIPGGKYYLGTSGHLVNPAKEVILEPFCLSIHEVTNAEFAEFVEATGYRTKAEMHFDAMVFRIGMGEYEWIRETTAYWRYPQGKEKGGIENKMNHPVTTISYLDALAYCEWAGVRLPTLNEWEAASRCGQNKTYYWGMADSLIHMNGNIWKGKDHLKPSTAEQFAHTAPVGNYLPNPWGLYDMYGNVFEFCDGLPPALDSIPGIVSARGGSWWCSMNSCNYFNSIDIGRVRKEASFSNHGFRVVKKNC
ncbi:SUMF1/EgtB/PvdO family nonheme iron enzyme [bacterium SCSIO 12741]|nr:SUMF1/EgtB/PvdO family nonheme iron enzyme [bacterium SCSIO 12741]